MHTLLIHQAFVSPAEAGGTRHYELARRLVDLGYRFTIVSSNISYLSGERIVDSHGIVAEQILDGIRILRAYTCPTLHKSFLWRMISFFSFMLTSIWAGLKAGPADIVMGTSPPIFQAISAWALSVIRRKPFLLEIRDLWPEFAIDIGVLKNPVLILLSRWLERFLYHTAIHIVVNSPAYRTYLVKKGVPSKKISLIPNGVDTAMFDERADGHGFLKQMGLNGKFVVTYAGALGMANDIPTILRAAGRLKTQPGICFLLVGDGKDRSNLESTAKEMHLDNVIFTGARPKSEMAEILAASDACTATLKDIPMFKTTYPNKVFDYMAAGRPTILGIDGVIREVIEKAGGGVFVPPGDDGALSDAIMGLEKDRARAKAMGTAARKYVKEHFDRERQAEQFICCLHRLRSQTCPPEAGYTDYTD
ncbi:MAG: glycosyltransferase family 4 protein [Deltaproteobacteria bacterium]|nr:glycosyltransferase family 4 protein [Deltaproteobacteria bacterium]